MVLPSNAKEFKQGHGNHHRFCVDGIHRRTILDGESDVMVNINRLFVMPTDSHITEERRIEEAIVKEVQCLEVERMNLEGAIRTQNWASVAKHARLIRGHASQIWIWDQRLQDVVDINKQYARIQEHIDRIEET